MGGLSVSDVVLLAIIGFVGYWWFLSGDQSSTRTNSGTQSASGLKSPTGAGASLDVDSAGRDFVQALSLAVCFYRA